MYWCSPGTSLYGLIERHCLDQYYSTSLVERMTFCALRGKRATRSLRRAISVPTLSPVSACRTSLRRTNALLYSLIRMHWLAYWRSLWNLTGRDGLSGGLRPLAGGPKRGNGQPCGYAEGVSWGWNREAETMRLIHCGGIGRLSLVLLYVEIQIYGHDSIIL